MHVSIRSECGVLDSHLIHAIDRHNTYIKNLRDKYMINKKLNR